MVVAVKALACELPTKAGVPLARWHCPDLARTAVEQGIVSTAGTVTSAAIVMVAVFGIFASLSQIDIKQMGFGLAVAILIDATIVRAVLLPATMKLLGKWNWYLPTWLEWLPKGPAIEGAPEVHEHPPLRPDPRPAEA